MQMLRTRLTQSALNLTKPADSTDAHSTKGRTGQHDDDRPDSPGSVTSRMVGMSLGPRDLDSAGDAGTSGRMRHRSQSMSQLNTVRQLEHELHQARHDAELWQFAKKNLYAKFGYRSAAQMEAEVAQMKREADHAASALAAGPRKARRAQAAKH